MATINKDDNLNQGLPENTGLDEGTRAALQRQLDGGDGGIKVGSFRDLQVGLTDTPIEDRPVNPNQDEEELVTIHEHMASDPATAINEDTADGDDGYEDMTKEQLQDELASRDMAVSGTKDELIARLRGEG
jgi:hypothetical protein